MFHTRRGNHRQSHSEDIRSQLMPYTLTTMATMTIAPYIPLAVLQHFLTFLFPPNVDFHTGQQQQFFTPITGTPPHLRSNIILVQYFQPLAHPNLPSDNHHFFFFHLVWATSVELLRVRGAVLWTVGNAGNACGSSEDESLS